MTRPELVSGIFAVLFGGAVCAILQPAEAVAPTKEVATLEPGCVRMCIELEHEDGLEAAKKSLEAKLETLKETHDIITYQVDEDETFETVTAYLVVRRK